MTAPIASVAGPSSGRAAAIPRAGRWYGPRVPLPPLSIEALRDAGLSP
ncbi:hypothetical protein [Streptomyces albireticuli]|nr:hypothetical protein [Streptomyces albireticuli]MCD9142349.1 hypothetical protein [Streptomyces albireticuli]MCD9162397.1 hypothetical protein [Streptomyces albireticuli]MCD9190523.1 hypothetical protein [Streptomyces albireticuli]